MSTMNLTPGRALLYGLALTVILALVAWRLGAASDLVGTVTFLTRWLHIVAGIVWVGLVWFVNLIQLVVMQEVDAPSRTVIARHVAPRVALHFRMAAHLTLVTGVLLVVLTGYMLPRFVYGTDVFIASARHLLLGASALMGIAMWAIVHWAIWPNLQVAVGLLPGDDAAKAAARDKVHFYARLNLVLAVPVTYTMVAAAHFA